MRASRPRLPRIGSPGKRGRQGQAIGEGGDFLGELGVVLQEAHVASGAEHHQFRVGDGLVQGHTGARLREVVAVAGHDERRDGDMRQGRRLVEAEHGLRAARRHARPGQGLEAGDKVDLPPRLRAPEPQALHNQVQRAVEIAQPVLEPDQRREGHGDHVQRLDDRLLDRG